VMSMSVCLSDCPLAYLKNYVGKLHQIFSACLLWPWVSLFLAVWPMCYILPVLGMSSFIICLHTGIMCIPKRQKHNSLNYCIDSSEILFSDKDQQVQILGCAPGAKSAICGFLVLFKRLCINASDYSLQWKPYKVTAICLSKRLLVRRRRVQV